MRSSREVCRAPAQDWAAATLIRMLTRFYSSLNAALKDSVVFCTDKALFMGFSVHNGGATGGDCADEGKNTDINHQSTIL